MINQSYRLFSPRQIRCELIDEKVSTEDVVVRPTYLSICAADQRYYTGNRSKEVLKKKLPMALIHEAIGEVVFDPKREYLPGTKVVMIPNTPIEKDEVIKENYDLSCLDIIGVSVEYDFEGNLIFALNYKITSNIEVKLDRPIKAPVIYLTELMEHLSYICQIIDTVQDYEKEAVVPDEIKKQLAQKINEIAFTKTNSQPKAEPIKAEIKPIKKEIIKEAPIIKEIPIAKEVQTKEIIKTPTIEKPKEPIKEEPIKKPEIKTEEPKAIKEIQDDTIDLMDIVEF